MPIIDVIIVPSRNKVVESQREMRSLTWCSLVCDFYLRPALPEAGIKLAFLSPQQCRIFGNGGKVLVIEKLEN